MIDDRRSGRWRFIYGVLVLLAIAIDAAAGAAAAAAHRQVVATAGAGSISASAARSPSRDRRRQPSRGRTLELLAEQRGELDPAEHRRRRAHRPGRRGASRCRSCRGGAAGSRSTGIWLRWRGPLASSSSPAASRVDRTIDVLPNVRGVQSAALQFFAQEAIYGIKVQRQKGEGAEFEALREYTPGLDSRFIDWKHSARHRKLLCKEFHTERNHQVVLAFDTGYLMREPVDGLARLDHAINAGLLLAWISLQGGDLVGTYGFDAASRHYLQPHPRLSALRPHPAGDCRARLSSGGDQFHARRSPSSTRG